MSLNPSIQGVPEDVVKRLRERAQRNHRSMQGELMSIVQQAAMGEEGTGAVPKRHLGAGK